jgi:hypothetical protein
MINNIILNLSIDPAALQRIWRQSTGNLVTYNSVQVSFDQPSLLLYYKTLPTYILHLQLHYRILSQIFRTLSISSQLQ